MLLKRLRRDDPSQPEGQARPRAVALGYDAEKDEAPRVLASGEGSVAERILAVAKENGILIREDPMLAAALATVDLDTTIPPELYAVVAEVLAYVYRVKERKLHPNGPPAPPVPLPVSRLP
jgi:flagellar biosynthesis protein